MLQSLHDLQHLFEIKLLPNNLKCVQLLGFQVELEITK